MHLLGFDRDAGEAQLEVTCSGGTYVRSLARDIAQAAGTYGFASSVRRTAAGDYHVSAALAMDRLNLLAQSILSIHEATKGMPRVEVGEEQEKRLIAGGDITITGGAGQDSGCEADGPILAFSRDKRLIAVLKKTCGGLYHPEKVFAY